MNRTIYVYGLRDLIALGWGNLFNDEFNMGINGTIGVGVEPVQHLSLELQATLFHLKVAGNLEASKVIFGDNIPVGVKALFAVNRQLDIMAWVVAPDLKNGFDSVTFVGGLNGRL